MIDIRKACDKDLKSLYALYDQIGKKEEGYFEKCLEDQAEGNRTIFIAAFGGKDAGYVILNFSARYCLYQKLGIPEIQDLNVIPDFRQQGVATALIQHCEDSVETDKIGISVGLTSSYGPAQRLYAKLGYLPDGSGVTYDRAGVSHGEMRPIDDDLCLMLIKDLKA